MFKLPVCPHCGTVYRYKDTKKAIRQKENECYHCHKHFRAKIFPYMLIEAAFFIILSILANQLVLSRMYRFDLLPLFGVTIGFLMIIYLLIPFFTQFKKTHEQKQNTQTKKKSKRKK